MTAQPNLKSASITNLDATPPVRQTSGGSGGLARLYSIVDIVGPTTTGDTTGGVLRCCRFPSNARVKRVLVNMAAATTTANFDVGVDYSDAPLDGTTPGNYVAGTALNDDIFAAALDTHAYGPAAAVDVTFLNSDYLPTDIVNPFWQASGTGLTADPGGFFDVILTNRATISGAATLVVEVQYSVE